MDAIQAGWMRALCFHDAWGYPPTRSEWLNGFDVGAHGHAPDADTSEALENLFRRGTFIESRGRVFFPGREALIVEHEKREGLFPRKIRRARRVAKWLASLGGVRFVALCNTTALAHARDEGDLDFFVLTKRGALWQTRGWAALPFKLMRARPGARGSDRDAVCLSFFADEDALDLAPLMLKEDDPYFRHWFLSLLPLFDDGVSEALWKANAQMTQRHPLAKPWIVSPDLEVKRPFVRIPFFSALESLARHFQERVFSPAIKQMMNRDTRVAVNDRVLKFHVEDGRERFREASRDRCLRYEVEP